MKRVSYVFILLCIIITSISCDDEPLEGEFFSTGDGSDPIEDTDTSQDASIGITANIDGDNFEANGEFVFGAFASGIFNITGISTTQTLAITIGNIDGPGTFDIGPNSVGAGAITIINTSESFLSSEMNGSGTITIETLDMTNLIASGTFEFIAENETGETIEVTNGTFNVSLM